MKKLLVLLLTLLAASQASAASTFPSVDFRAVGGTVRKPIQIGSSAPFWTIDNLTGTLSFGGTSTWKTTAGNLILSSTADLYLVSTTGFIKLIPFGNVICSGNLTNTDDLGTPLALFKSAYFGTSVNLGTTTSYKAGLTTLNGIDRKTSGLNSASTADQTVSNTITDTAITPTFTAPANSLKAGTVILLTAQGYYKTKAAGAGNFTVTFQSDGVSVVSTGSQVMPDGVTNNRFTTQVRMTVRSIGLGGTLIASGCFGPNTTAVAAQSWQMVETSTTAIDTTSANTFSLHVIWQIADTDNSITFEEVQWEVGG